MKYALPGIVCILLWLPQYAVCQTADTVESSKNISASTTKKYVEKMSRRSADIQVKMEQGTEKYLNKLKDQEELLQKQLSKVDAGAANRIFSGSQATYDKLQNDIKTNSENV